MRLLATLLTPAEVKKSNENHDAKGQFASGSDGGMLTKEGKSMAQLLVSHGFKEHSRSPLGPTLQSSILRSSKHGKIDILESKEHKQVNWSHKTNSGTGLASLKTHIDSLGSKAKDDLKIRGSGRSLRDFRKL